jgi:predicted histidine transporter YuiF (NhaC family)
MVPLKEVIKSDNGCIKCCHHFRTVAILKMANLSFIMRTVVTYQEVFRSCVLINEIWIEYVEFITLDNLRGRVVHIVVGLIILIPFKTSVYPARDI